MKLRTLIAGYVLALALFLFAQRHPDSSSPTGFHAVVDLTHSLDAAALAHLRAEKSALSTEQFETRIDAPAGFSPGLWTVEQIPAERLLAPLVVLDVIANTRNDPDYQISVEDIAKWEMAHNQIPFGSIVMARTGWDSRWHLVSDYRNVDSRGVMHFP